MKVLLLGLGNSPVKTRFISNHYENFVGRTLADHEILTFGYNEGVDIRIDVEDDFQEVVNRLPDGWRPDCCILWELEWNLLPKGIESAPFPTVCYIADWDYDIPFSIGLCQAVDLTVVPTEIEKEAVAAIGASRGATFIYIGAMKEYFKTSPARIRDRKFDVIYTTFIDDYNNPERSKWILKLINLPDRYNVLITNQLTNYSEYTNMLNDAKLVFSHHRFGGMSGRVLEAGSCGAVVIEPGVYVTKHFIPDEEFVFVTEDDFEAKIERLLDAPETLQTMSDRFYAKVTQKYESRIRFADFLDFVEKQLGPGRPSAKDRGVGTIHPGRVGRGEIYYYLFFRTLQVPAITNAGNKLLIMSIRELEKDVSDDPSSRNKTNLAVAYASYDAMVNQDMVSGERGKRTVALLHEVISQDPLYVMAHFNLGLIHMRSGNFEEALRVFHNAVELFENEESIVDPWCLHNLDFELFKMVFRKPLNHHILSLCKGGAERSLEDIRILFQAVTLFFISLVAEKKGDLYKALDALVEAHNLYGDSGIIEMSLAKNLALLGYDEESREMFKMAIKRVPFDLDLRLEYIKFLYLKRLDKEVLSESNDYVKLTRRFTQFAARAGDLRKITDSFARYHNGDGYSHDLAKEMILNNWLHLLYNALKKNPKDLRLILRIADLWQELGRADKIFELTEEFAHKYGDNLSSEESGALKDIYSDLQQVPAALNRLYTKRLDRLNNLLSNTNAL